MHWRKKEIIALEITLEREGENYIGERRKLYWREDRIALERGENCIGEGSRELHWREEERIALERKGEN